MNILLYALILIFLCITVLILNNKDLHILVPSNSKLKTRAIDKLYIFFKLIKLFIIYVFLVLKRCLLKILGESKENQVDLKLQLSMPYMIIFDFFG